MDYASYASSWYAPGGSYLPRLKVLRLHGLDPISPPEFHYGGGNKAALCEISSPVSATKKWATVAPNGDTAYTL